MASGTARRFWKRSAIVTGAGLVALLLVRLFVGDVYRVETRSMRPTIMAGNGAREWVFVRHGAKRTLERHDMVVVRDVESGEALVKRVVGLPNETLQLVGGDLLIDGRRRPLDEPRPAPVVVFDSSLHDLVEHFYAESTPHVRWHLGARRARLEAGAAQRGSDAALAFFHKPLLDDHVGPDGERVTGSVPVGDAHLSVTVEVGAIGDPEHAEVRLRLLEAGDTFEVRFGTSEKGARLVRRPGLDGDPEDVLARAPFEIRPGERLRVTLRNVDDQLAVDVERKGAPPVRLLRASYDGNRPYGGALLSGGRAIGPRAAFGATGLDAVFEDVVLARDVVWLDQGRFGTSEPLTLGPDEIFVLGDDSAHSRDSRNFGPLRVSAIVGRPIAVLWPLRRARSLPSVDGAAPGP